MLKESNWYHVEFEEMPFDLQEANPELIQKIWNDKRFIDKEYGLFVQKRDIEGVIKDYNLKENQVSTLTDRYYYTSYGDDVAEYRNENPKYWDILYEDNKILKQMIEEYIENLTEKQIRNMKDVYTEIFNKVIKRAIAKILRSDSVDCIIIDTIKKIIKEQGIKKNWLADKVDINYKTFVDKLTYSRFTAEEFLRIAKVLNIDLNKLKEEF
jgi:hypothetical protein